MLLSASASHFRLRLRITAVPLPLCADIQWQAIKRFEASVLAAAKWPSLTGTLEDVVPVPHRAARLNHPMYPARYSVEDHEVPW